MAEQDLAERFRSHEVDAEQADALRTKDELFRDLASDLDLLLPNGREKALVMTKLEEAMFWAGAAIARAKE